MRGIHWLSETALAVGLATVVGITAGCGSNDGASAGSGASTSGHGDVMAYLSCLSEHGVTLPVLPSGAAQSAQPSGVPTALPPGLPSGMPTALPSGAAPGAMRSGTPGGLPGGELTKPSEVDDTTWQQAQAACVALRPS